MSEGGFQFARASCGTSQKSGFLSSDSLRATRSATARLPRILFWVAKYSRVSQYIIGLDVSSTSRVFSFPNPVNELAVEASDITPEALRAAIRDALDRHADREMDKLEIDIERGRVTLHGRVQSWREHDVVVGAVTGTRGVKTVIDRLRLA